MASGSPHLYVQDIARLQEGGPLSAEGGQPGVGLVQEILAPAGTGKVHVHVVEGEEDPLGVCPIWHGRAQAQEEIGGVDRADGGALRGIQGQDKVG